MPKYLTAEELWRLLERSFARLGKDDFEEFFRILMAHYASIRLLQHPDMIQLRREMQSVLGTFFSKPDRPVVSETPVASGGSVPADHLTAAERRAYLWLTAHIEQEKAQAAETKRPFRGLILTDTELKRKCRLEARVTARVYDFAFRHLPDEDKLRASRKKKR